LLAPAFATRSRLSIDLLKVEASLLICCELDRLSIIQRQPCCKPFPARPALLQSNHAVWRSLRTRLGLVCLNFVRCVFLDCGKGCALKQNLRRIASLFKIAQTAFEMRRTVWSSGKVETT
jgi:hypothetical protein